MTDPTSVTLVRRLKASPERVWRAWAAPDESTVWGAPEGMEVVENVGEVLVGGRWRTVMRDKDGRDHVLGGAYREVVEARKLVFTWTYADEAESLVTVLIEPDGAGTRLTLTHDRLATPEDAAGVRDGWTGALDKLERYLA